MRCEDVLVCTAGASRSHPIGPCRLPRLRQVGTLVLLALSGLTATGCSLGRALGGDGADLEEAIDASEDVAATRAKDKGSSATASDRASATQVAGGKSLSNEGILEILRAKSYRDAGFKLVNPKPYPSTVAPGKTVSLYVSEAAYEELLAVSPDRAGSQADVPTGTMIVREVLKGSQLDTITVMVKLPEGSFPLGGDWWYAATDPDGTVRQNADDGTPVAGLLERCGTCHIRRNEDDFLFGVPDGYLP